MLIPSQTYECRWTLALSFPWCILMHNTQRGICWSLANQRVEKHIWVLAPHGFASSTFHTQRAWLRSKGLILKSETQNYTWRVHGSHMDPNVSTEGQLQVDASHQLLYGDICNGRSMCKVIQPTKKKYRCTQISDMARIAEHYGRCPQKNREKNPEMPLGSSQKDSWNVVVRTLWAWSKWEFGSWEVPEFWKLPENWHL